MYLPASVSDFTETSSSKKNFLPMRNFPALASELRDTGLPKKVPRMPSKQIIDRQKSAPRREGVVWNPAATIARLTAQRVRRAAAYENSGAAPAPGLAAVTEVSGATDLPDAGEALSV
jgi:hypothetical protein